MKRKTKHTKDDNLFQFWYAFLFTQVLMTRFNSCNHLSADTLVVGF